MSIGHAVEDIHLEYLMKILAGCPPLVYKVLAWLLLASNRTTIESEIPQLNLPTFQKVKG